MKASGKLLSIAAIAAAMSIGVSAGADNFPRQGFGYPSGGGYGRYRERKHNPAGTKLARKASRGMIGIRKGW
jgi:hypothetical protein